MPSCCLHAGTRCKGSMSSDRKGGRRCESKVKCRAAHLTRMEGIRNGSSFCSLTRSSSSWTSLRNFLPLQGEGGDDRVNGVVQHKASTLPRSLDGKHNEGHPASASVHWAASRDACNSSIWARRGHDSVAYRRKTDSGATLSRLSRGRQCPFRVHFSLGPSAWKYCVAFAAWRTAAVASGMELMLPFAAVSTRG